MPLNCHRGFSRRWRKELVLTDIIDGACAWGALEARLVRLHGLGSAARMRSSLCLSALHPGSVSSSVDCAGHSRANCKGDYYDSTTVRSLPASFPMRKNIRPVCCDRKLLPDMRGNPLWTFRPMKLCQLCKASNHAPCDNYFWTDW